MLFLFFECIRISGESSLQQLLSLDDCEVFGQDTFLLTNRGKLTVLGQRTVGYISHKKAEESTCFRDPRHDLPHLGLLTPVWITNRLSP
jgi:hypothetical protein